MYTKYMVSHIFLGALSNMYPSINLYFFIWQIFQFIIGKRIFLIEKEAHHTNNLKHTLRKISEYMIGKFMFNFLQNK
jgi:hypothetical protein